MTARKRATKSIASRQLGIGASSRADRALPSADAAAPLAHATAGSCRGWRMRPAASCRSCAGASVLETLRDHGIPHAALCGGRARCTTCRVLVTKGLDQLPAPSGLEAVALARIGATPGMRLACQLRPSADIAVMPLLAADAGAVDGSLRGGLEGSERLITVVFVDMRGSTTLGEAKLPYDVLFILNRFFPRDEQGDGRHQRPLFAIHRRRVDGAVRARTQRDPTTRSGRRAVAAPARCCCGSTSSTISFADELTKPLRIGIGIHYGEAIVGAMGPPRSQIITAIGDTVNTCARLESLTKDFDCVAIVSRPAAEACRARRCRLASCCRRRSKAAANRCNFMRSRPWPIGALGRQLVNRSIPVL